MPLHVLQLGPYPPPEGGISRNIVAIRDGLSADGHTCSIVATSKSSRVTDEPDVYHPHSALALIRLLRKIKFDVLHLHIGGDLTPRLLTLAYVCSIFGAGRSVLTVHSGGFAVSDEANAAKPSSFSGFVFRRFSRIVAVNEKLADVFRRFGVKQERVSVIRPFALGPPNKNVRVPQDLRGFCEQHSPLLVSVGGLEKDYDPLMQIEAMKDIVAELPRAGLMLVGGGSMLSQVETAIANSRCAEAICLAGNVEHPVTLHLMNEADVVLRTTLFDADAISVREALFLGTPVIATDNGMRPQGVHLIEIGDKDQLTAKVVEISHAKRTRRNTQAADTANIAAVIETYLEINRPVTDEKRP